MIQVIGRIQPPPGVEEWRGLCLGSICLGSAGQVPGLLSFLSAIIKLLIVIAGLYAFINIILAGYGFLTAYNEPEKINNAWAKIWQSATGLLVIAGSFVLAAIFGHLIFGNPTAILKPVIYGP